MSTRHCAWVRSTRTHTLCTFKGTLVEVNHTDMTVEPVTKGKGAMTGGTTVVALFEMSDAVVLVCVASFGKRLVAGSACEWFETMSRADVDGKICRSRWEIWTEVTAGGSGEIRHWGGDERWG